jgi:hypothetical protein
MPKSFIILGICRSGTSLVAKGLNAVISLGNNFYPANRFNPAGYYEDIDIMKLNHDILESAGGTWKVVPNYENILAQKDKFSGKIQDIIKEKFAGCNIFGIKNPFMTLTIDLWMPFLPHPHIIAMFREPIDVANSIIRMEGGNFEDIIKVVKIYNERLLDFLRRNYENISII